MRPVTSLAAPGAYTTLTGSPVLAMLMVLSSQPPSAPSTIGFHFEPNWRPLPKGSWYTKLVVLIKLTSKLDGPRSAARLYTFCGLASACPEAVSSACSESPKAFDQVKELRK